MKLKDKEAWLKLYEIAGKIQKLEPWNYLNEDNWFMYDSKEFEDVFYCSVAGHDIKQKVVSIYQGSQINRFLEFINGEYPEEIFFNYQECLSCNFVARDETLPKNIKIIKEIGLKFRGTWISFENMEKGYEPSPLNMKQVNLMIDILNHFYMMFEVIKEQDVDAVNIYNGQVLARYYDEKNKIYVNYPEKLMVPEEHYKAIEPDDKEGFKKKALAIPKVDMEVEYDFLNYLPLRIIEQKERDGRYYYPRGRFIADVKSGIMIEHELIDKNDYENEYEYIYESVDTLFKTFQKIGRPKKVYVRDEETKWYLSRVLKLAEVKLEVKNNLDAIDEMYETMWRMM